MMLRKIVLLAVVVAVASLVVASAADVSFPDGQAGSVGVGAGVVMSPGVSAVKWTILSTDPSYVDKVAFTTSAAANGVYARVGTCGGAYPNCTFDGWSPACASSDYRNWTCDLPNTLIQPIQALQVSVAY